MERCPCSEELILFPGFSAVVSAQRTPYYAERARLGDIGASAGSSDAMPTERHANREAVSR
jgi:hypothetical protein